MKTITDTDSLISDLQTLLTHPHATPTITLPPKTLSLPRQVLSARNRYFQTLLSPRWQAIPLTKPNTTSQQFQDLLEFLITGCITLSSAASAIPHNVALAALAHETLAEELERVVSVHIRNTLTRHTLTDYLSAVTTPLPPVDALLTSFLSANTALLATLPHAPPTVAQVCRLLSAGDLPPDAYPRIARYITASALPLRALSADPSLRAFLLRFPTTSFVCDFEPLFTRAELLRKYRSEAMAFPPDPPPRPRIRLLHESTHPHPRPPRDVVTRVVLPSPGFARLVFDKRSSLAGGAELAFFLRDPRLGTHPCKFLVGRKLEPSFVLPANRFWYVFACTDVGPEEGGVFECRWGWKFFVEACSPESDDPD